MALLTQIELVLIVILGVLVGLASHSAIIGLTVAWGFYTFFYVVTQYVALIASKLGPPHR